MSTSKNTSPRGRTSSAAAREAKRKRRRKKIIKVWIRRILFGLAVLALLFGIVFLILKLTGGKTVIPEKDYDLPDYITEEYIKVNKYSRPKISLSEVNDIVIHYVGNPGTSAEANRNYFNNLSQQKDDESATYGSSNFIVGLEGEILAVVPIDEIAYCSNNRNSDTLSIEVCHPDETGEFNEVTYASLVKLTAYLCDRFELSADHIIRHYDVTGKLCPLYYVEHEDAWEAFKADVAAALEEMKLQAE